MSAFVVLEADCLGLLNGFADVLMKSLAKALRVYRGYLCSIRVLAGALENMKTAMRCSFNVQLIRTVRNWFECMPTSVESCTLCSVARKPWLSSTCLKEQHNRIPSAGRSHMLLLSHVVACYLDCTSTSFVTTISNALSGTTVMSGAA